jgi:putative transposase
LPRKLTEPFSRQVVGWAMDEQMPQELTLAALDMAIKRRRPLPGLMHHSDRGSQGGFKWSSQHPLSASLYGWF